MAITIPPPSRRKKMREEKRRKLKEEQVNRRRLKIHTIMEMTRMSTTPLNPNLPCLSDDLVLDNILSRLPYDSLIRFSCVCKLWYYSINHDLDLSFSHFIQSRNNPILLFNFFNVARHSRSFMDYHFFYLKKEDEDALMISMKKKNIGGVKLGSLVSLPNKSIHNAPIGYCNGLVCLYVVPAEGRLIRIINPSRRQVLDVVPPIFVGQSIKGYGFGFDSLTKEYKVVCILNSNSVDECCLVYTLGRSNPWRKVRGPGPCQIRNRIGLKAAVSCDGALYWRTDDIFEVLSFDLHEEKFEFIEIPIDGLTVEQIWFHSIHYMEYKGCLCFVSLEEFQSPNCKVHMFILEDRIEQRWIKETLFAPFLCEHNTNIGCFSDQVLLYWFYGDRFLFYNLHTKVSNVLQFPDLFLNKRHINALSRSRRLDFHLYSYVPNSLSLRTFNSFQKKVK
ncbi:F-box domain [Macleaya cordata]|uniref:F-box domain n=1 Tax=Macleaya cordata TaxID=56857 RepID=A0A200QQZ4_MACCD|nr:F-box domain [Macleaya cordata]